MRPAQPGATLDFTAEEFAISNGGINLQGNTLTNAGTLTLTNASSTIVILYANNAYAGGGNVNMGGTVANTGTIVQQGAGSLEMFDSTVISNQGTYQFAADSNILLGNHSPTFVNTASGTVKKTASTGTSSIEVPFDNQGGTLDAESGTLDPTDGGSNTGGTYIANGSGIVDLTGGSSPTFTGTYTGSGTGVIRMASGTLAIGAAGAAFNFPSGLLTWTGGTFTGTLTNTSTGTIPLSGITASGTLDNLGTITQTGGTLNVVNGSAYAVTSGTVNLAGSTGGTLTETSSTVNVETGTYSGVNTLTGNGGTYNLIGTLTNNGTLALTGSTVSPAYLLEGGTIESGTVSTTAGATRGSHPVGRNTQRCNLQRHAVHRSNN